ncbi:cytochrome C [Legionella maioricensis]|uniref:Cytochrome C n=1 Tax=Legionella maioricensis TaxID=2896528 RepID=A0A9X2IB16_9GAMM|nr:cytochrome C [Legionella maioricensis]MCL9683002.1 cytochrome C [Legionella maioricensis]MCL9686350.1 cytochrome C [Legionella maioricensis]
MKNLLMSLLLITISGQVFADDLGKKTYQIACQNCHAPQFSQAIKAPTAFNKKEWDIRFKHAAIEAKKDPAQYKSAMDYLLYSLTIGKGLMQHGGLCNESNEVHKDCSNEALTAAINYMSQR